MPVEPTSSAPEQNKEPFHRLISNFRALTPLIYGQINSYGTFQLNMSERLNIEHMAAA